MELGRDRGVVGCASMFNWISLFLGIVACSTSWSWGFGANEGIGNVQPSYGAATVAANPFVAGIIWKPTGIVCSWWYPCWQTGVSTFPLYWNQINSLNACTNSTASVFTTWAQPYGYCQPNNVGGYTFQAPVNPINTGGLIVAATVIVFFAAVFQCIDAGSDFPSKGIALVGCGFSLLAMVLFCAAFALYGAWNWALNANSAGGTFMPAWLNPGANLIGTVPVVMVWGPGFGCAVTSFVLSLIATVVHALSLGSFAKFPGSKDEDIPNVPGGTSSLAQI